MTKRWKCPGCGRARQTEYCPACGEEALRPRDLHFSDMARQLLSTFSNIDGRLIRSFRLIFLEPGALSAAHVAGNRRHFVGPLPLFLICNAIFFAVQSAVHAKVFSSTLHSHLSNQDWSELAHALTASRLVALDQTLAIFAPRFDQAATLNAKALIILMALAFVPFLPATFPRSQRVFGAHLIFALHLYAFILILLCFSMILAEIELRLGGAGLESPWVDLGLSLFNFAICAVYLYWASGRFYGSRGIARFLKTVALTSAIAVIVVGYRFVIFLITLYTTGA